MLWSGDPEEDTWDEPDADDLASIIFLRTKRTWQTTKAGK
jgi:hypothetical protein